MTGASLRDRAATPSEPSQEVVSGIAGIPSAGEIAARCEAAAGADQTIDLTIIRFLASGLAGRFTASFDAALTLLGPKHDWRRLTPTSISVYAGSPYNAAAQTRYDGYGATPALQLCAAFFKMCAAIEAKAIATEARRAAVGSTDAVHERATAASGDAQTTAGPSHD